MTKVLQAWTNIGVYDNGRFHLKYQMWADPADVANNRTYVWRRLLLHVDEYGSLSAGSYAYSGTGMTSASGGSVSFGEGDHVLLSSEGYVTHNADGTWSQAVSGSANFGNYYVWSCSGTAELETIPRASVPSVSPKNINIGASTTVYTNRASTSFTHTVTAKFGSSSTVHSIATNVGDSCTFNSNNFVSALVSAQTSGKVTVMFTVTTYQGSTQIGEPQQSSLILSINPSVPTVDKSSITIGETVTLSTNRTTSSRTHTVVAKIGSTELQNQTGIGASTTLNTNTSTIKSKIMSAIGVSGKSGKVTFTVTTFVNGVSIGSKTVSTTVNVDTTVYKPRITFGTLSDTNSASVNYHGANEAIRTLTNISLPISFDTTSQYSELASAKITFAGSTHTETLSGRTGSYTLTANAVTTNVVSASVTDKRGTTVTASKTFTLLGYINPALSNSSVSRTDMTGSGATYAVSGKAYAGTYTGSSTLTNSVTLAYRYKEVGGSWAISFTTLRTASLSGTGNKSWSLSGTFPNAFDYTKQYDIQFRIRDGFGEATQTFVTLRLYNGTPIVGWGETHFDVYGKFHIHDRTNASERWVFPDALDAVMYTQGSKNLLQCTSSATTYRGVEYTYDIWNRPTANGTATGGNSYILYGWFTCTRAGTYTLSGCPVGGSGSLYYLQIQDSESTAIGNDYGSGFSFDAVYGKTYKVYIIIQDGRTVTNVKFAPMVRNAMLASTTYTPFAPPFSQLGNFALMAKGTISNANSATDLGIYRITSGTNTPATSGLLVTLNPFLWADESALRWQIFLTSTPVMYMRYRGSDGTWTAWRQVTSA